MRKAWLDTIGVRLQVGVNLSARQFQLAGLEEQIADVLRVDRDRSLAALSRDHREPGHGRRRADLEPS